MIGSESKIGELGNKIIISDRAVIRTILKEKEEHESQLDKLQSKILYYAIDCKRATEGVYN